MASRIGREELLDHPLRQEILRIVDLAPGIPFLDLYLTLKPVPQFGRGMGYGSLAYHIGRLEEFGLLTNRKAGRYRRYYRNGGPYGRHTGALAVLQTPPIPVLARILLDRPGVSQTVAWRRLDATHPCTRQAVGFRLGRLVREGLLTLARGGRSNAYYPTERMRELMAFVEPGASTPAPSMAAPAPSPEEPVIG